MKTAYSELFKFLVKASISGELKGAVQSLINNNQVDKDELAIVISNLCGVQVDFGSDYYNRLEEAIIKYKAKHKIVTKLDNCGMDCKTIGSETQCQRACPFNAIIKNTNNSNTYIDPLKCTDCGFCVEACPQNKIIDKIEFIPLQNLLKEGKKIIAAVAPAIAGQFGEDVSLEQIRAAFKKMGFTEMVEVAFFADMLSLKEAVEFDHHVKTMDDLLITSCCCPMWVGMLKRVYSNLVKDVSPSVSPMIAAGRVLKKLNPDTAVVFIGPCVAKKAEAKEKDLLGDIDFVMTFAELKDVFEAADIDPSKLIPDTSTEYASMGGRLYARTGGVSTAVRDAVERMFPEKVKLFKAAQANGVPECKEILKRAEEGNIDANFIEGMGCVGGCVGGPKALIPRENGKTFVDNFAEGSEIKVAVDSTCMNQILNKIDIDSKEDFKNPEKIKIFERNF